MKITTLPLLLTLYLLPACGDPGHSHEHGEDGHDHGAGEHHDGGHGAHVHAAPHGGLLVILAEEAAHLELVHDAEAGELRAYLLGAHAETPVRSTQESLSVTLAGLDEPLSLAAVSSALTGETVGDSSEFLVQSDALREATLTSGTIARVEMIGQVFEAVSFEAAGDE